MSAWAKIATPEPVNLKEIISEEIQGRNKNNVEEKSKSNSEDEIIARMLQIRCEKNVGHDFKDCGWEQDEYKEDIKKRSIKIELANEEFTPTFVSVVVRKTKMKPYKPCKDAYERQSLIISKIISNCSLVEHLNNYEEICTVVDKFKKELRKAVNNKMIYDKRWVTKIKELNINSLCVGLYWDGIKWLETYFWSYDINKK